MIMSPTLRGSFSELSRPIYFILYSNRIYESDPRDFCTEITVLEMLFGIEHILKNNGCVFFWKAIHIEFDKNDVCLFALAKNNLYFKQKRFPV